MLDLASFVAVFAAALFTGAAVYINIVEHPARLECGPEIAVRQWAPSYRRATVMQVTLALVAMAAGIFSWYETRQTMWLVGSGLIFAVIPFTAIVVMPTNRKLLDPRRDLASDETQQLLVSWGKLHGVRSALSVAATAIFLLLAIRGASA